MRGSADAEKSAVPRLRFPEFRGLDAWDREQLADRGDFQPSLTGKSAEDFDTGDASFVPYMNVFENTFTRGDDLRSVDVGPDERQTQVRRGDVFFTVSSETQAETGMSSVLLHDLENVYLNSFCALFRFTEGKEPDPVFTGYLLRSAVPREHLGHRAQGSTRFNLSKPAFRNVPLLLPSAAEQRKIAACLGSLDAWLAAEDRKLAALARHKRGLLQQLFPREGQTRPHLRFPEFRDAGEWKRKRLEDIAKRGSGHTPSKNIQGNYDGGVKWISLADSNRLDRGLIDETSKELSELGLANSSAVLHPAGTVILSRDAGVGRSAVMGEAMAVSQHFITWTCDQKPLLNWFFYYLLQQMKPQFEDAASGSTIKTIGVGFFKTLNVLIPGPEEQARIAACLSTLDARLAAQAEKIDALRTHKRGLMQQLFPAPEDA